MSPPGNILGLNEALDFERRKKEAIQRQREQTRSRLELPAPTNSPHRSRYLAAKAALASEDNSVAQRQQIPSEESPSGPILDYNDPRAYLMRQQSVQSELSKDQLKIQRTQTKKLPLEKIPEGHSLHGISLTVPAEISQLSNAFSQTLKTDLYTQSGVDSQAHLATRSDDLFQLWIRQLSALVKSKYRTNDGSQEPRLQFDLSAIEQRFNSFNENDDANV